MKMHKSGRQRCSSHIPLVCFIEACEPRRLLTAIASDQTLTGTIAAAGQVDAYTFTATAGQAVMAAVGETVAGSPLTVSIELRAPDASLVAGTTSSDIAGTLVLTNALTQTGTYTLNVRGLSNTTGSYAVTVGISGVAPVATPDAGPTTSGAYRTAPITLGDLDVHTIAGTAGGSLLVSLSDLSAASGFDPQVHIFTPSGTLLDASATGTGTARLESNLPATGTYYVFISDQFGDEVGDYGLTVASFPATPVTDADSAALTNGVRRTGTIDAGDIDLYTISGTLGGNLLAAVGDTDAASGFDPQMIIFSPTGAVLSNDATGGGQDRLLSNLPASGTYTIAVFDQFGDETGAYALTASTFPGAQAVDADSGPTTSGLYKTGTIDVGDFDTYTVQGTSGGSLLISIGDLNAASGYDPTIYVFTPAGVLLDSSAGGTGTVRLESSLAATGTYYIVVLDQFSDETGAYGLTVTSFGGAQTTDADSGPIASGERRTGAIDPGDIDVYTISANSAGSLLADIGDTDAGSGFDPAMIIFSPTGAVLSNDATADGTIRLLSSLAATGSYSVAVFDQFSDETGAYALSVARFGGSQNVTPGDQGGSAASGEYKTGNVDVGDFDIFTLSASAGNTLVASLGEIAPGAGFDPALLIFSPTGAVLNNSAGAGGTSVILTDLATTGTYSFVAFDQFADETGEYGLTATRFAGAQTVAAGDEGGALTSGERRLGRIAPGDIDSFTFNLATGNGMFVSAGETVENEFSPRLIVLNPAGDVLLNSFNAHGRDFALPNAGAATAGLYTAIVLDSIGGNAGEYALTGVAIPATQPTDDDSGTLTDGGRRAGSIPPGDVDVYTFNASAGQSLTFRLAETGGNFDPQLFVYGPTGAVAGATFGAASAQVVVGSAAAGTYTVVVDEQAGDGSGAYSIALNTTTGTDTAPPVLLESAYRFNDMEHPVRLAFSEDVSTSFDTANLTLKNRNTNLNVNPDDLAITFTATAHEIYFGFNPLPGGILPDANYRLSIPANKLTDIAGNPLTQDIVLDFYVLAGDANRDRNVDFNDLVALAQNYNTAGGKTFSQGDFSYDGNVDFNDLVLLAQRYNTSLPPIPAPPVAEASTTRTARPQPQPVFSTTPITTTTDARRTRPAPRRVFE